MTITYASVSSLYRVADDCNSSVSSLDGTISIFVTRTGSLEAVAAVSPAAAAAEVGAAADIISIYNIIYILFF